MDGIILLGKNYNNPTIEISLILLIVFLVLTICIYNIYKGTKIVLPNLEEELKESSNFHLLKSIGWSFTLTIFLSWFFLSKK
jgi:hypothetical protein